MCHFPTCFISHVFQFRFLHISNTIHFSLIPVFSRFISHLFHFFIVLGDESLGTLEDWI